MGLTGTATGVQVVVPCASARARAASFIQGVAVALENQWLKIPADCDQLYREPRGYQLPDTHVVQDSVMALAIAVEHAAKAHSCLGRIVRIIHV